MGGGHDAHRLVAVILLPRHGVDAGPKPNMIEVRVDIRVTAGVAIKAVVERDEHHIL